MSGGEGVRNPADLTPVIDELDDIDDQLDDIEAALVIIDGIVDAILVDTTAIELAVAVIDGIVDAILVHTTLIEAVTSALPTLSETGGTVNTAVINTEYNVYVNLVPLGVFNPVCVKIDFTNQAAAETVIVRTYYRIVAGVAAPILQDEVAYVGQVSPELINIDLEPNRFGVRVTMERTVGAAQDYDWEAFYEI